MTIREKETKAFKTVKRTRSIILITIKFYYYENF